MRMITDGERRTRLAIRHGLATEHRHTDVEAATRAMTVLHATEAATVHLSLWARVDGLQLDDVEHALYGSRTLVKQAAMRSTQFVFPRDLLPAALGSAARRTATAERKRLLKSIADADIADPEAWVDRAGADVLGLLADGNARTAQQIREQIPALELRYTVGRPDTKWGGSYPIGPRVLWLLAAEGRIMRAGNAGHWRLNKPTWTAAPNWLGEEPVATTSDDGYAELVRHWLWTFGPGTEADLVWWLGATKTAVRRALAALGAAEVRLESGETGWVLGDDPWLSSGRGDTAVRPWVALLPTLDPTVMGWKERDFYLDPADRPYLFDSNGNAGNTAWCDGRIIGSWAQDDEGRVHVQRRGDVGAEARAALDDEAERLTEWLAGTKITNVYASRQMKQAQLP